jgi:hypothetical protein
MSTRRISFVSWNLLLILPLFFPASFAWAYRPFVSTDAAIADVSEIEIELGYFNLQREGRKSTFGIPSLVINYGLIHNLELVGEFTVEEPPSGPVRLADPGLSLKGVLKEGVLQEKTGISLALEAGLLLPSTDKEERHVGFEAIGILSGRLYGLTYHLNLGAGVDRSQSHGFLVWGAIAEWPLMEQLRLVGEINGSSVKTAAADNSILLGCIWTSPFPHLTFDAGVRKGISRAAADWMFTTGLTFSFSLPRQIHLTQSN